MHQVLLVQQFYHVQLSRYEQLHLNMQSQYPHFPKIWRPRHNQDALCSEHILHLQKDTMFQVKNNFLFFEIKNMKYSMNIGTKGVLAHIQKNLSINLLIRTPKSFTDYGEWPDNKKLESGTIYSLVNQTHSHHQPHQKLLKNK